jgi:hypothetical protein
VVIDGGKPKDFDADLCSGTTWYTSRMLCLRIEVGLHIITARILKQNSGREKEYSNTCGFKLGWERMLDMVRDFRRNVAERADCGGNASDLCWRLAVSILGHGTDCL